MTMPRLTALLLLAALAGSLDSASTARSKLATIETNLGSMTIELDTRRAPRASHRFERLVLSGRYGHQTIYRVVAREYVQGGIGYEKAKREPAFPIDDDGTLQNRRGSVGFAREEPNDPSSGTTELYICLSDQPELDKLGFKPFGRIIKGFSTLDKISNVEVRKKWLYWDGLKLRGFPTRGSTPVAWHEPLNPIVIERVVLK